MRRKIAVTLTEDLVAFLDSQADGNRSQYLNSLLAKERQRTIEAELIKALQDDCSDPEYLAEIQLWDTVVADGLDDAEG
ncbi:CopG family transcriptional regulator [Gloeocapsopsis sp. IPPAS B-1203]|uniref:type II toxin-antitoxin system MazE family antitoxin n=1 Tax=Gloeocapsopsis sp. IPPAS B-1203 TaxID=2049454 RepID=UPI000C19D3DA|nr:CopG family transcriptional regulator [Gloeocapsopsis sp. IPPAS B-1203]PIG91797.1 CopG family transcriptional regulator [Gloeocapsopsis sp. IPPAS B-1203]